MLKLKFPELQWCYQFIWELKGFCQFISSFWQPWWSCYLIPSLFHSIVLGTFGNPLKQDSSHFITVFSHGEWAGIFGAWKAIHLIFKRTYTSDWPNLQAKSCFVSLSYFLFSQGRTAAEVKTVWKQQAVPQAHEIWLLEALFQLQVLIPVPVHSFWVISASRVFLV